MAFTRIKIDHDISKAKLQDLLLLGEDRIGLRNLADFLKGVAIGIYPAEITTNVGAIHATGLVTFTGAPTADDTLVIAGVTFTAKASGATGNQFNIGGSVTITAANLAAAINASSNLSKVVSATSAEGVVTLTAHVPGKIGNGLVLTEALDNATVTAFSGGLEGDEEVLELK